MNYSTRYLALLALGLATSCQSKEDKAAAQIVDALQTSTENPAEQAKADAWKVATTLPPALPASAVNVQPGVAQMLPEEGYLELVSVTSQTPVAAILALPAGMRNAQRGYPKVGPGYRIPFEAVLRWKPMGFGKSKPGVGKLQLPTVRDSLRGFFISEINRGGKVVPMQPAQPVKVQGVLYAYTNADGGKDKGLLTYPYRGLQISLPLAN
jgi:pyruvate/2-oxoglutarate dehydrogenase complex dihydrolipoamide acyltransferase (E2) component